MTSQLNPRKKRSPYGLANGIRDLQQTVSEGISQQLLKWKGIEATEILAKSNNAKVIVIGGADGLPLILNTRD